jgi:phage N-6-adenine-methyltransferase
MSRLFAINNVVDSDDWYTPAWVFDGLGLVFDLDVAAPDGGAPNVPSKAFYALADDGLTSPWHGVVWCNPPYSAPTTWCRKWATHEPGGCLLVRADLSTGGPFAAWTAAHAAYVPPKRLQFDSGAGRPTGAVNFSTILLGRGELAVVAMERLASLYGGTTHRLTGQPARGAT